MRVNRRRPTADADLLVRTVCHELRPPMATLTGLLRALERQPSEQRRSELTRLAAEHVSYAEAVLAEIAATVREVSPTPLGTILETVAVTAPPGVLTVTAGPDTLRWPVHPRHTQQILINLVGNAVRHGTGPVRLWSGVRARRLRLAVIDRGGPTPGLRTALRRRTPPPDDNGLGLWVVRQRLADLSGTIRARRLRPAGLAMEVTLPPYRP